MYVTVCAYVTCLIIVWHSSIPLPACSSHFPLPFCCSLLLSAASRCSLLLPLPALLLPLPAALIASPLPIQSPTTPHHHYHHPYLLSSSLFCIPLPSSASRTWSPSSLIHHLASYALPLPLPPRALACHSPMQFPTTPLPHQPALPPPHNPFAATMCYMCVPWLQPRSCQLLLDRPPRAMWPRLAQLQKRAEEAAQAAQEIYNIYIYIYIHIHTICICVCLCVCVYILRRPRLAQLQRLRRRLRRLRRRSIILMIYIYIYIYIYTLYAYVCVSVCVYIEGGEGEGACRRRLALPRRGAWRCRAEGA